MNDETRFSWDRHAARYQKENTLPFDVVDYCGGAFPTEKDLKLLGDVKGLKVLELGAGACNVGIALAKQGAIVTCLDGSKEQLEFGKKNAEQHNVEIETVHADFHDLDQFDPDAYDLVISICALQYAEDIKHIFSEVHRMLKSNGRFVFSTDHPMMKAVEAHFLYPNDENLHKEYHYKGAEEWKWNDEDDYTFTTYRRPVSDFLNTLTGAGLKIKKVIDLYPIKELVDCSKEERQIRKDFPSILVISAEKSNKQLRHFIL